ncbi:MAG: HK97 family phage prohead protease [Phycisphaerae bacterium]|nr:HK97 family phage prohead protease [Phycisphaerae bacterium]
MDSKHNDRHESKPPERLDIPIDEAELRIEPGETPMIVGYATRYSNWYPVGGFVERIKPGAFDDVLASDETDVIASMNHNVDTAFARQSAGTLRISSNSVGLRYEADIVDDDGKRVRDKIIARTIKGSSFMFGEVDDLWEFTENEPPKRTITRVGRLYELGPVVWPANTATSVKARADEILAEARSAYDHAKDAEPPQEAGEAQTIDTERLKNIEKQYRKAQRIINRCRRADA